MWQAALACVLGNLSFILVAYVGTAGPIAGTPTLMISRAQYGIHGNRLSVLISWVTVVAYEAIDLSIAVLALVALAKYAGWNPGKVGEAIFLGVVAVVTFGVAILGHATLVVFQKFFAYVLIVLSAILIVLVLPPTKWGYSPQPALHGGAAVGTFLLGTVLAASAPLSWIVSPADITRYFRRDTSPRSIWINASVGFLIPGLLLTLLGVLAGTAVSMADPTTSMRPLMPGWFYPIFLLVIVGGMITNNVFTVYTSGLSLQALGVTIRRSYSVWIDAIIGTAMTVYALFISNFLTSLTNFLTLALIWYGPFTAIFVVDVYRRHRQYDGYELHKRGGKYWYKGGFSIPGMVALLAGMAAASLFSYSTYYQGPLSTRYLYNGDISVIVGGVVGGVLYWLLARREIASTLELTPVVAASDPSSTAAKDARDSDG